MWNFMFFFNSALFGVGLAMDAFSVSVANGLHEPCMNRRKGVMIAGLFAFFQTLMPLVGWFCIHNLLRYFQAFSKAVPYISLALLGFIGGKMIVDGLRREETETCSRIGFGAILLQGVATSIDALSVGFTIATYGWLQALVCALIIGGITFGICLAGVWIGKKFGTKLSEKAIFFGGIILIFIGLEIFITNLL